MKMILKKIIFLMFLSGSLHLSLSATQANDPLVSQNINSIESNILNVTQPTEAEFTQKATAALKKFFIKDSKLHTAFR